MTPETTLPITMNITAIVDPMTKDPMAILHVTNKRVYIGGDYPPICKLVCNIARKQEVPAFLVYQEIEGGCNYFIYYSLNKYAKEFLEINYDRHRKTTIEGQKEYEILLKKLRRFYNRKIERKCKEFEKDWEDKIIKGDK